HWSRSSGLVYASQTRSSPASNSAVTTTVFVGLSTMKSSSILFFLFLLFHGGQQLAELVHPRFPDLSILLQPFIDLFHFFDLERVINFSSLLFLCNEFAFRQYPQMLGNGLSRGVKMLGDSVGSHCLERDQRNDRPPRRV